MTGRQTRGNLKRTNDQRSALASIDAWLRNLTYGHASISSASVDFRDATAAFVLALDDGDSMTMTFVSITDWSAVQQMSALQDDVLEAISDRWGEPEFNVGGYVA